MSLKLTAAGEVKACNQARNALLQTPAAVVNGARL